MRSYRYPLQVGIDRLDEYRHREVWPERLNVGRDPAATYVDTRWQAESAPQSTGSAECGPAESLLVPNQVSHLDGVR